jgi:hypothetical protein
MKNLKVIVCLLSLSFLFLLFAPCDLLAQSGGGIPCCNTDSVTPGTGIDGIFIDNPDTDGTIDQPIDPFDSEPVDSTVIDPLTGLPVEDPYVELYPIR